MLTLNLVSERQKKEIKLKSIYTALKGVGIFLVAASLFFAIIFSAAKIILKNDYNQILGQTALVEEAGNFYVAEVKDINKKIVSAGEVQSGYMPWSRALEELVSLTPASVTYSYLKIDQTASTAEIKGKANNREDLLLLKENLNSAKIFSDVELPLGDILRKENINFNIIMKLNILEIKK